MPNNQDCVEIRARDAAGPYKVRCHGIAEPGMNFYGVYENDEDVFEDVFEGPEADDFNWTDVIREITEWCHEDGFRLVEVSAV